MVTVRLFGAARAAAGAHEVQIAATSLAAVKEALTQEFPALVPVLVKCSYLVNEVSCRDDAMTLNDNDVVDVLPPFAGG